MGLNANMDVCRRKKKCLSGPNEGRVYDPLDPCTSDTEEFQADTCTCIDTSPCGGNFSAAGGPGVTVKNINVGAGLGTITFRWQAYAVKDSFVLSGAVSFSTGTVSGAGTVFLPKTTAASIVTVTVTGPQGTAWNFGLSCAE